MPTTATTTLPDEQAPALGNGVKDEVAVTRSQVTNNGDIRYQLRRAEDDTANWEDASSFQQFIGAFDTLTFEFVGLLDGEQYEVRGRTETAYRTGAWTTPETIVTKFPGFDNFQITATRESEVDLSWADFADNEDGTRVQRRAEINGSFGPWDTLATLPPNAGEGTTVTYTDTAAPAGTTLEYRIQPFTPYTEATSNALETTTDGTNDQNVSATGYHVEVVHPETGRVRVPDVVDLQNAPVFNPGPNAQPVVRVPVAKNTEWLRDAYDDDPEMRVWRDGRRLPIEVLRNVEQREGATVLIGVGGVELEQRVTEEYNDDRRHLAVRDLVESEIGYGVDAPAPDVPMLADQSQQVVDSEPEWLTALDEDTSDTDLYGVAGGTLRRRQTAYFAETDDLIEDRGTKNFGASDEYNWINNDYWVFDDAVVNQVEAGVEHTFTLDHKIPEGEAVVAARMAFPVEDPDNPGAALTQAYTQRIDGTELDPRPADSALFQEAGEWQIFSAPPDFPAVGPGDVEVEIKMTGESSAPDDAEIAIDALMVYDGRAPPDLTDAVTVPERKAQVDLYNGSSLVETDDVRTGFIFDAAELTATVNDTSGNQRVGVSNDRGQSWTDATNAPSVTADFTTFTSTLRTRFEVGGFSGETTDIVGQVNGHEVDAYELFADIRQELLLIEEAFDNSLASVLSDIGEPAERSWGLKTDANGDIVVRFVQNGQFTADFTPEFSNRTREKLGKTYDSVTVKGSHEPESNVPYTASTTFTDLPRSNILEGSETVYDDTTNYERGDDYEINYRAGELRAVGAGDLAVDTDYRVDFEYQAEGTYLPPDAPADPSELVETVPGVTSQRLAEQVAFIIQTEADAPRYAAEVTIPDSDPRFDPTDALPPSALGLPSAADDLEVRGEPQLTEEGLRVRFGTRPSVEQTQQRLSRQLSRVSDRS